MESFSILQAIEIALVVIGGASLIAKGAEQIASLTATKKDDEICRKITAFLEKIQNLLRLLAANPKKK